MNKNNHLIVFIAYKHFDIIKTSFDSISKYENADYFVVENSSENSDKIQGFFRDKNIKAHIRFNQNIANSAITVFINDYWELLQNYDYVTITDGDIYIQDINATFEEVFSAFQFPEVVVSSVDLWLGNHYENQERKTIKEYKSDFNNNKREPISVEGHTGGFLITIPRSHLFLIKGYLFTDSNLIQTVNANKCRWYKTNKNLGYHLTWDLYYDGNEYYEWKKQVYPMIWTEPKSSDYLKLI